MNDDQYRRIAQAYDLIESVHLELAKDRDEASILEEILNDMVAYALV